MHCFIVNPGARRGRAGRSVLALERALRERRLEYRIAVTERPGHATELARDAIAEGADAVVAVGGDGTINEVLNGLDDRTPLGIIPIGTCDDVARNLRLPRGDLGAALDGIASGHSCHVDTGRCNDRRFLTVVGAGMDSRVAVTFKRLPRLLWRRATYVALVLKHLATRRPSVFRLTIDGEATERRAWMVVVANTEGYAGGMRIAPDARPNDGLLRVCIVGPGPRLAIARVLPRVYRGRHLDNPHFHVLAAKSVEISCEDLHPVIADGEIIGELPVAVSVEPNGVAMLGMRDGWSAPSI